MTSFSVIPEIFNRESRFFQYCGPLIDTFRGDEKEGDHCDDRKRNGNHPKMSSRARTVYGVNFKDKRDGKDYEGVDPLITPKKIKKKTKTYKANKYYCGKISTSTLGKSIPV